MRNFAHKAQAVLAAFAIAASTITSLFLFPAMFIRHYSTGQAPTSIRVLEIEDVQVRNPNVVLRKLLRLLSYDRVNDGDLRAENAR